MLSLLHIENIALIQSADIQFEPGFNVLTGETGAGKSIVIDSIGAVLGERTSRELIRTGARSALVSAVFTQLPPLPWLEENGFSAGGEELTRPATWGIWTSSAAAGPCWSPIRRPTASGMTSAGRWTSFKWTRRSAPAGWTP